MTPIISNIEELRNSVRINASIPFETVEPFIDSARDIYLVRYLGPELVEKLETFPLENQYHGLLRMVRKALGPLAMWLGNAELSVRISDSGFTVEKTDKYLPAHDAKIAKVEESLEQRAFQYLDLVLEYLEKNASIFPEWTNSRYYSLRGGNYIRSAVQFQECGVDIEYSRLTFEHFRPLMRLIEDRYILALLGDTLHERLLQDAETVTEAYDKSLVKNIRSFVACKTAELYTSEKSKRNRESDRQAEYRPVIRPIYGDPAGSMNFFAEQADSYLGKIQSVLAENADALGLTTGNTVVELKRDDVNLFFSDAQYTFN